MSDAVNDYLQLRAEIDQRAAELLRRHGRHIVCRAGCCDCCINLTVLPVEFEAIRRGVAGQGPINFDFTARCGFLAGGRCTIYCHRPIICRTHGLPIAFSDDDDGRSVSFCEQNFSTAGGADLDFGPENTLDLDDLNDRLAGINRAFLARTDQNQAAGTRIDLSRLV